MRNIYDMFHLIWRQHPRHASTFSQCPCKRMSRRGGGSCLLCLKDKFTASGKVTPEQVDAFYTAIRIVIKIETDLVDVIGEDEEFELGY